MATNKYQNLQTLSKTRQKSRQKLGYLYFQEAAKTFLSDRNNC